MRNYAIKKYVKDGLLYATDDIVFEKKSLHNAYVNFNNQFPNNDGVLGFIQKPSNQFHPTGVALIGKEFLVRYPDKQLFYPGYFHFACQDIHRHATKINKFVQDESAIIWHYNPCKFNEEHDQTHNDARVFKANDMAIINYMKQNGLIWGYNLKEVIDAK